jgi:hypothetical protein
MCSGGVKKKYGKKFGLGDVITCCIDLKTEKDVTFYINGESQGVAMKLDKSVTASAYFPTIVLRNARVLCNFGMLEELYPIEETTDYLFMEDDYNENLVVNQLGQDIIDFHSRKKVILLVGLPYAGKSSFAKEYVMFC